MLSGEAYHARRAVLEVVPRYPGDNLVPLLVACREHGVEGVPHTAPIVLQGRRRSSDWRKIKDPDWPPPTASGNAGCENARLVGADWRPAGASRGPTGRGGPNPRRTRNAGDPEHRRRGDSRVIEPLLRRRLTR